MGIWGRAKAVDSAQLAESGADHEAWSDKDYSLHVTQAKDGFFCTIKLAAKVDLPPRQVFAILARPDSRNVFRSIEANPYRKIWEDDGRGRQKVETESRATWRFLMFKGSFSTRLFVWLDEKAGTVLFKLARPGLMKAFEGKWTVSACDGRQPLSAIMAAREGRGPHRQHHHRKPSAAEAGRESGADSGPVPPWAHHAANLATNFKAWLPGPEAQSTLVTLEQSLQPAVVPPKPLDRAIKGISAKQVHFLLVDLRKEVERIRAGGEVPPWYDQSEWDETDEERSVSASADTAALMASPTEGRSKQRLRLGAAPAASLSMRLLEVSQCRIEARQRRAVRWDGASAAQWRGGQSS